MAEENMAYKVYLKLRAVLDIVLAPQVSRSAAPYLQTLIEDFYSEFSEIFPDVNIIPKMHYIIHYPRLLLSCGPLSKLSCMRFEAKHQFSNLLLERPATLKTFVQHWLAVTSSNSCMSCHNSTNQFWLLEEKRQRKTHCQTC